MTKNPEDHAGSGLDKANPKTLKEKIGDGPKKIIPETPAQEVEPDAAPTIIPSAD